MTPIPFPLALSPAPPLTCSYPTPMLKNLWNRLILSRRREIPFMIFFWFLLSFIVSRLFVLAMESNLLPDLYLNVRGIHVHHFNYGLVLIIVTGFIALAARQFTEKHVHGLAITFGIGLGLIFDEFSLFILLEDNYWARHSYDAVVVLSLIFLNIIYFHGFWGYIVRKLRFKKKNQPDKLENP